MYFIHHNDDDGRCAAAIAYYSFAIGGGLTRNHFIEYDYGMDLDISGIPEGSIVYILDLSLSPDVINAIKELLNADCVITFIDHHKTTHDFMADTESDDYKEIFEHENFYWFVKDGVSGALLTFVYSSLSHEQRQNREKVYFDFPKQRSHFMFFDSDNEETRVPHGDSHGPKEHIIPLVIRMIDDNDVWLHDIPDTMLWKTAFMMYPDKHPLDEIWERFIYGQDGDIIHMIEDGRLLLAYQEQINETCCERAFEFTLGHNGIECKMLCLNQVFGNSTIFGDRFDEYKMVCKYSYDGEKYKYTLYSSVKGNPSIDEDPKVDRPDISCQELAKSLGGGGHVRAAGFDLDYCIFDDTVHLIQQVTHLEKQQPAKKVPFWKRWFRKDK